MRLGKKILLRPKCENCGKRIYRTYSPFRRYYWRSIPSHCPRCGAYISFDKIKQLKEHEVLLRLILCIPFLIVILVIILN